MWLAAILPFLACGGGPDSSPDGAVRELVRLLGDEAYEPGARERAFALLDPATRRELARRARAASESTGRPMEAADMLVPGATSFRFQVKRYRVVEERVDRAIVEVRGAGSGETARIRLVREGDAWRVVLPMGREAPG